MEKSLSPTSLLPRFWWLSSPLGYLAIVLALIPVLDYGTHRRWFSMENSLTELATAAIALSASLFALWLFARRTRFRAPWAGAWFMLAALGCFYIAGEEISWGQHFLDWESPEVFAIHNKQGETNIHNMHHVLGRLPKALLEVGAIVIGIVFLASGYSWERWGRLKQGAWYWYSPSSTLMPAAVLIATTRVIDRFDNWFNLKLTIGFDELGELYISYFILLYLIGILRRAPHFRVAQHVGA